MKAARNKRPLNSWLAIPSSRNFVRWPPSMRKPGKAAAARKPSGEPFMAAATLNCCNASSTSSSSRPVTTTVVRRPLAIGITATRGPSTGPSVTPSSCDESSEIGPTARFNPKSPCAREPKSTTGWAKRPASEIICTARMARSTEPIEARAGVIARIGNEPCSSTGKAARSPIVCTPESERCIKRPVCVGSICVHNSYVAFSEQSTRWRCSAEMRMELKPLFSKPAGTSKLAVRTPRVPMMLTRPTTESLIVNVSREASGMTEIAAR